MYRSVPGYVSQVAGRFNVSGVEYELRPDIGSNE